VSAGSLRRRLLVGTIVWILVSLVGTGLLLSSLFREHITDQMHHELRMDLDQLTAGLDSAEDGSVRLAQAPADPRLSTPYSGLYWQVSDATGTPLLRSRSLWDQTLPATQPAEGEVSYRALPGPAGTALVAAARIIHPAEAPQQTLLLQVAADRERIEEPLQNFHGILIGSLGLLALGLIAAALIQVRSGLAPLDRLRTELAKVREGRDRRLDGAFPAEIQPLVDDFNEVLTHDTEVLTRARTQAGNLAHALKTPLSILANAADREDAVPARLVGEQVSMARRQVDYHLARARAASAAQLPGQRCPVTPLLEGLLRVVDRLHAERGLEMSLTAEAAPDFRGEAQDFQEMAGNLVDNACKWARTQVTVTATGEGDRLVIRVDDDGPGVPTERRAEILLRGARADESVPGSGLGLAIVQDLAELYGGSVQLADSPLGGLSVILCLPAA
jgi:signal transduction histidine kinase